MNLRACNCTIPYDQCCGKKGVSNNDLISTIITGVVDTSISPIIECEVLCINNTFEKMGLDVEEKWLKCALLLDDIVAVKQRDKDADGCVVYFTGGEAWIINLEYDYIVSLFKVNNYYNKK